MKLSLVILFFVLSGGIYDFSLTASNGSKIDLNEYKGKKILFVNVASASPYSNQLKKLDTLWQQYHDQLAIIAVPSNSFNHEPLSDQGIDSLLNKEFHIHYLVTVKSTVTGASRTPLYKWLTTAEHNKVVDNPVLGDFQKFLISEEGKVIGFFSPTTDPLDDVIKSAITGTIN